MEVVQKKAEEFIFLNNEFDKFWEKIIKGENFAFIRNADGERAIMCGKSVSAQEGNWKSPSYVSKLGKDIYNSLSLKQDNVYYAISCPCCDLPAYYWYSTRIENKNKTFANLWINSNFEKFKQVFPTLTRDAVLIANYRAKNHKIGNLNIIKHYEINDDCITFWENNAKEMIENIKKDFGERKNLLYVVSAGPMSSPIIFELYKANPDNCYIDFGSAIDIYYRENISRPYMIKGNTYADRNCFMNNPKTTNFDVSVILNLYKRPEYLKEQLFALENQTLKPKEILLYQDGTVNEVKISEELKLRFNLTEISPINKGVWARFDFAKRCAVSEYVCVFDDDTIPGERWLENCYSEMQKQEGLYGTIGVIMKEPTKYPMHNSYFRVGWDGNLDHTTEVDFVGHSWFFKKDWLRFLFEAPEEIQSYKLAGEDMSFSYQLLKQGIKTFVPPHPKNQTEFFGSIPQKAYKFGTDKNGISINSNNLSKMNDCIKILLKNGWSTLSKRKKTYIRKIYQEIYPLQGFKLFKKIKTDTKKIFIVLGIKITFNKKIRLENVDNILYTHTDYSDVWGPFFSQMNKYFNVFENNYVFVNKKSDLIPDNYIQIIYDDTKTYSERLLECFSKINKSKICFFQHEDMFLYDTPEINLISKYVDIMQESKLDFIRMIKSGDCISKPHKKEKTLHNILLKSNWIFSIQPSFWNTKRFINLLEKHKNLNIWDLEICAQKSTRKMKIKGCYSYNEGNKRGEFHYDNKVYPYIATAIVKGKWNIKEYSNILMKIFEENNVDPKLRGFYE